MGYFPEPYTHSKNKIKAELGRLIIQQNLT